MMRFYFVFFSQKPGRIFEVRTRAKRSLFRSPDPYRPIGK